MCPSRSCGVSSFHDRNRDSSPHLVESLVTGSVRLSVVQTSTEVFERGEGTSHLGVGTESPRTKLPRGELPQGGVGGDDVFAFFSPGC